MEKFLNSLPQLVILLFSIVFHEVAHGQVALWRGDPTAKQHGRLTLNPIPHIDPFGTILFPLLLIVTRSPVMFGWARPVPINPLNFRKIKKDMALVGASGPASNFLLAIVASLLCRWSVAALGPFHILSRTLIFAVSINLMLAVFNLIPIPPLDGSRIVVGFLPDRAAARFLQIERYGFVLLFALLFFGLFDSILFPVVNVLFRVLLGG